MKVIEPIVFQESHLLSTTAVETVAAYNAATSYSIGNQVDYGIRIYESLVNTNVGNTPGVDPLKWQDISPDNKHAMFDGTVNTQTEGTTPLEVSIEPGQITTSLALINIVGTEATVEMLDEVGGSVVYTKTINLDGSIVFDWYSYFFEPFDFLDTVVLTDLPPYSACVINVSLANDTAAKIGNIVYGNVIDLGLTQTGVNFGIRDFSVKDTDEYGNTIFVQRTYSKRMEPTVYVENTKLRYVDRTLARLRATPTVWIGSEDATYSPLVIFGFYRDYNIDVPYPSHSLLRLDLEGII